MTTASSDYRSKASTGIEWTESTWNPFVGCFIKSAGCKYCYAMSMAARLEGTGLAAYQGTTRNGVWTGVVNRNSDNQFNSPRKLKKASLVFVNSMSDFWHENANDDWRHEALNLMRDLPQHRFQILTKRPQLIAGILARMNETVPDNVWLGCTLEDHRVADRAAMLAAIPARVRFLSIEPITARVGKLDLRGIHWVITGGESGTRRRPNRAEWTREVRDQCIDRGRPIPYFHKQWGAYESNPLCSEQGMPEAMAMKIDPPSNGKGGALLDGRLWREFPEMPGMPSLF